MKKLSMRQTLFLFLITFCLPYIVHSQSISDDFEGNGSITSWFGDDCDINTTFTNPFKQGINNSEKVLRYMDNGGQYANARFDVANNFDLSENHIFTFKIYVPSNGLTGNQVNKVSLKLQDGTLGQPWTTQTEVIKPILLNQWQTVTINYKTDPYFNLDGASPAPINRKDFNRVLIQVNGENNNDRVLAYIDDIDYNGEIAPSTVYDKLIWSDEFNINGAIDNTKWFHQTRLPNGGSWYNGEIQHYTNRQTNSFVADGILKIVAKKESFNDQGFTKQFTSARLNSKFAFKYGKVEVRAKLPTGVGTWPAIWMLGKNINEDGGYWDNQGLGTTGWPACGEIDIMEHWGNNQNFVQSAIHTPSSFGNTVNLGGQIISTASTAFHIYTFEWTPEKLVFSVNNVKHYTYNPAVKDNATWPFDAEQYFLLNIAIQPSIVSSFTQSAMEIDYIRVYQQGSTSSVKEEKNMTLSYFPNPVNDVLIIPLEETSEQNIPISVFNISGQLVRSEICTLNNDQIAIDGLGNLQSGMYIVSFPMNNHIQRLKIVKN